MNKYTIYVIIGILTIVLVVSGCVTSEQTETPIIKENDSFIGPKLSTVGPTPEIIIIPIIKEHIVVSSIPDDYYNIKVDQYFVDHKLYNYLDGYTWNRPVWKGSWSMVETTELEKILTDKGCNVTIRLALIDSNYRVPDKYLPAKGSDGYERSCYNDSLTQYSSWLMIELDGEMTAYNACYGFWIFEPDHYTQDRAVIGGKWRDDGYYNVGGDWTSIYYTGTMIKFIDFKDIYELENYYLSGKSNQDWLNTNQYGKWFDYANSDEYNATDDFLITFGWWIVDDEFHKIENRINEATNWFSLGDI
jgi:hypothetical protein